MHTISKRRLRELIFVWFLILPALFVTSARGQDPRDRSRLAEELFNRGRSLEQAGEFERACECFEEGWRADSTAGGNLLALAACLEKINKTASAHARYKEILEVARRLGRTAREQEAIRKLAELESTLYRIIINVDESTASIEGLEIRRNGKGVPRDLWNQVLFVDPEPQQIDATAPGRRPFVAHPLLSAPGMTTEVTIRVAPLDSAEPTPQAGPPAADTPISHNVRISPLKSAGYVVGGVGLAGLLTGTALTIGGWVEHGRANDDGRSCKVDSSCYSAAQSRNRSAQSMATAGNITAIAGALLLATGATMVLVKSEGTKSKSLISFGLHIAERQRPIGADLQLDW